MLLFPFIEFVCFFVLQRCFTGLNVLSINESHALMGVFCGRYGGVKIGRRQEN